MKIETKNIPGWPGYQATSDGKIIGLEKIRDMPGGGTRIYHKRIMKKTIKKTGYFQLDLYQNGKHKTYHVHKLIAITFLGECPEGYQINHKDGNKLNNNVSNLEYVTPRENSTHYCLKQKSSSKYTGAKWCKKKQKWLACFTIGQKQYHLGYFDLEIDAHNKYQTCLKAHNNGQSIDQFILTQKPAEFISEFKGVHWVKQRKKWKAAKTKNKERIHIGYFTSEIAAYNAYINA